MNIEQNIKNQKIRTRPMIFLAKLQEKISTSKSAYLAFCFIVPLALTYLVYLALGIYPFGDSSVLILDLNGQYVYFFEALRNTIYGDGSFLYSFFRNLGGEFMGMYAYYLASPLSYLVVLFPQDRILDALLTIILLKAGFSGLTFGYYLHKNSKQRNPISIITFSAMYALCAYSVVYQHNIMWMDAMIWLPLVTLGIEQLIKRGKYKLFVISLSLLIISHFYIGYMACIFVAIYFFYYLFANDPEKINLRGEKFHKLLSFARIALFSVIALAISAFMILCAYYSLTFGKNDFSNPNWSLKANFNVLDFLTKFLPGSYDTVRPQGLPLVYCGVLTLILVPVYFLTKKISSREKIASLIVIGVFILSFVINPFDLIWHGFQSPNWLNYRYSFMLCFILLILAYKGLGNLRSVSEKIILAVSAFIVLLVAVCEKFEFETYVESDSKLLTWGTVWLTIFSVVAILVVLCLIIRHKPSKSKAGFSAILAIVVCIELFCSSLACVVQFDNDVVGYSGSYTGYSAYNGFIGDIRPIVNEIKNKDGSFYRMEKLVHRKTNDNMALGIRGLTSSTSTLNAEVIALLNRMGYSARSHKSTYLGGNPVNDSIFGIKYLIDNKNSEKLVHFYDYVTTNGKYAAYSNPYAMSLAYGVNASIKDFDIASPRYGTHFDRLNATVGTMIGDPQTNIFIPVDRATVQSSVSSDCTYVDNRTWITYSRIGDDNPTISYTFTAPKSAEYYFYTPAKYASETSLKVTLHSLDTDPSSKTSDLGSYLGSDTNSIMSLGYVEEGQVATVTITLGTNDLSLYTYYDYIWYIDEEEFNSAFTTLKGNPQFNISEYTDDNLKGSITTVNDSQTILTTIPYDEGWKIYVDGTEVSTYKTLDALITFDIATAGEHTLEFKYSPSIYKLGTVISIAGIIAFALLCIVDTIIKYTLIRKKKPMLLKTQDLLWELEDFENGENEATVCAQKISSVVKKIFKSTKSKSPESSANIDNKIDTEDKNNDFHEGES